MLADAQAFSSGQGFFPTNLLVHRQLEFLSSLLMQRVKEKKNLNESTEIQLVEVLYDHIAPDNS